MKTLDVLNGIDLSGSGTGINIGRDLNLLNVGGGITLSNGANFIIGRNLGLVSQPPKGTGTGSNVLSLNFTTVANSHRHRDDPVGRLLTSRATSPSTRRASFGIGGHDLQHDVRRGERQRLLAGCSQDYGSPTQTNPPVITQLRDHHRSTAPTTRRRRPSRARRPTGYVTALQGVTP